MTYKQGVDLRTCKPGDLLKSVHGAILTYEGTTKEIWGFDSIFPHVVRYPGNAWGTRTDDGQVFTKNKLPEDHDIVEIL